MVSRCPMAPMLKPGAKQHFILHACGFGAGRKRTRLQAAPKQQNVRTYQVLAVDCCMVLLAILIEEVAQFENLGLACYRRAAPLLA